MIGYIGRIKLVVTMMLLLLFILHNVGFFLVYTSIKHQQTEDFQIALAKGDFSSTEWKTAEISISFPYQPDQKQYIEVDETVKLNGTYYHIVKRRYENNTLHIVYIDDKTTQKVNHQFSNWKEKAGKSNPAKESHGSDNLLFVIDYQYLVSDFTFTTLNQYVSKELKNCLSTIEYRSIYLGILSPPPKATVS